MPLRLLLTLLALVAAACAGNRPPPVRPPPVSTWTLGVAVTVTGEGTPISHAKVEIREGPAAGQIATTGADGGTFFPLLPQAVYSLCANADGFAERCLGVDLNRQQNVGIDLERMQQPPPDPVEGGACRIVGQLRTEPGGGFVDDTVPSMTGKISYVDVMMSGSELPSSSKVTYNLNANKLTKQQIMNFFKLWTICIGPTNDE